MGLNSPRPPGEGDLELLMRAWRGTAYGTGLVTLAEVAYAFIDYRVFSGALLLPVLRVGHVLWALVTLGVLLARRQRVSSRLIALCFAGTLMPFLLIFALAEHAMAFTGHVWVPMTGHRLVMLAIGVLAPTSLWLGGGLIATFALEAVVLWYALGLGTHAGVRSPWEPWVTAFVYGGVAVGMLAFRVRSDNIERKLRQVRTEAEALERLARLFLAVRDATNTPLQTLELSIAVLKRRSPESASTTDTMERAVQKLRSLTQRLGSADPLLVWREGDESFDAETILRRLEEDLARELERRRQ
jgi:hypothetical protein